MPSRIRLRAVALVAGPALVLSLFVLGCVERSTEHRIRANALFKSGNYREALAECDLGLEDKHEDLGLWVTKGKTAFELGDFSTAKDAYARAVTLG